MSMQPPPQCREDELKVLQAIIAGKTDSRDVPVAVMYHDQTSRLLQALIAYRNAVGEISNECGGVDETMTVESAYESLNNLKKLYMERSAEYAKRELAGHEG